MAAVSGTRGTTLDNVRIIEGNKQGLKQSQAREQLNSVIDQLSSAQVSVLLLQALQMMADDGKSARSDAIASLSKRELEVLALLARGNNRRDIGDALGISVHTAARHIANMYAKLGVSTVAEAANIAFHSNLVDASQAQRSGSSLRQ
jgi:DNA-binding CsgD family transcriptional regulator